MLTVAETKVTCLSVSQADRLERGRSVHTVVQKHQLQRALLVTDPMHMQVGVWVWHSWLHGGYLDMYGSPHCQELHLPRPRFAM